MMRREISLTDDGAYLVGLFALTVATGVVDAVSYLSLDHVFTGNMTGNVLFVGFGIADSGVVPLLNNVIALAGFVVGAMVAGRAVRGRPHKTRLPTAHLLLLVCTAVGILVLAVVWLFSGDPVGFWLLSLTAALALTMGVQAVAARGAQISDVTTVVITSTLVNFAVESPISGGSGEKWVRRAGAVLSMAGGGALGALTLETWSPAGALFIGGCCMAVGVTALALARRRERSKIEAA
ncbi:YoaK family protein [Corynebacterium glyciniphilum]|uniref:Putative membrane protein n=1 Tax=Corynebacterium glyciniphilum AJ 3170 TaxID=1404245 RepID=X5DQA2_9CORY|nr:YoaK family protein [Corynebacterium glyciniphilum]AHW62827.1 Putative membrane protein [Corynebacterium glyciniphilum AJ 3170]